MGNEILVQKNGGSANVNGRGIIKGLQSFSKRRRVVFSDLSPDIKSQPHECLLNII